MASWHGRSGDALNFNQHANQKPPNQEPLSFGPNTEPLPLERLNVLIGPNGSGKSNFLEAISLLQAAPKDLSAPVKEMGGIRDWLWQGKPGAIASLEVIVEGPADAVQLHHFMGFTEHGSRFEIVEERIEQALSFDKEELPFFYRFQNGHPVVRETTIASNNFFDDLVEKQDRELRLEVLKPEQSILSQLKDPERYPVLSHLDSMYSRITLYREWTFGRYTPSRQEQRAAFGRNVALFVLAGNLVPPRSPTPDLHRRAGTWLAPGRTAGVVSLADRSI